MRGISMSSVITSGSCCRIMSRATNGSAAPPTTSMSGSRAQGVDRAACGRSAESSTMSTRVGGRRHRCLLLHGRTSRRASSLTRQDMPLTPSARQRVGERRRSTSGGVRANASVAIAARQPRAARPCCASSPTTSPTIDVARSSGVARRRRRAQIAGERRRQRQLERARAYRARSNSTTASSQALPGGQRASSCSTSGTVPTRRRSCFSATSRQRRAERVASSAAARAARARTSRMISGRKGFLDVAIDVEAGDFVAARVRTVGRHDDPDAGACHRFCPAIARSSSMPVMTGMLMSVNSASTVRPRGSSAPRGRRRPREIRPIGTSRQPRPRAGSCARIIAESSTIRMVSGSAGVSRCLRHTVSVTRQSFAHGRTTPRVARRLSRAPPPRHAAADGLAAAISRPFRQSMLRAAS